MYGTYIIRASIDADITLTIEDALGGELELLVKLSDRPTVVLKNLSEVSAEACLRSANIDISKIRC